MGGLMAKTVRASTRSLLVLGAFLAIFSPVSSSRLPTRKLSGLENDGVLHFPLTHKLSSKALEDLKVALAERNKSQDEVAALLGLENNPWPLPGSPRFREHLHEQALQRRDIHMAAHRGRQLAGGLGNLPTSVDDVTALLTNGAPYLGTGPGQYYATVQLGTPPQYLHVQMDTGSELFWVQCECVQDTPDGGCVEGVKQFNPGQSVTFEEIYCASSECQTWAAVADGYVGTTCNSTFLSLFCSQVLETQQPEFCDRDNVNRRCPYIYAYGTGTATGVLAKDQLKISCDTRPAEVTFGCSQFQMEGLNDTSGLADGQMSGIMGLGRGKSVVLSLFQDGVIPRQTFSICLGSVEGGGAVQFGAPPPSSVPGALTVTMTGSDGPGYYGVDLQDILVNGESLTAAMGSDGGLSDIFPPPGSYSANRGVPGVVIDTGTTVPIFPTSVGIVFTQLIKQYVSSTFKVFRVSGVNCWITDGVDAAAVAQAFPSVQLQFTSGDRLTIPFANLFMEETLSTTTGTITAHCLEVVDGTQTDDSGDGSFPFVLIGETWLQNFLLHHDLGEKKITLAPFDCSQAGVAWQASDDSFPTKCDGTEDRNNAYDGTDSGFWGSLFAQGKGFTDAPSGLQALLPWAVVFAVLWWS